MKYFEVNNIKYILIIFIDYDIFLKLVRKLKIKSFLLEYFYFYAYRFTFIRVFSLYLFSIKMLRKAI
jgi:hypothetical protein